ncbi:MAG: amidohydrolase family protein [Thermodesulfovibrionales bacterium]|nr:amidohydrolase family protein [Thermodesulfovibrionales bacterium]
MQPVDYIICGDYILTMNEKMDLIRDGAVAVKDTKIVDTDISENIFKKYSSEKIIEGKNRAVLPGLINTHTHAAMVYFRGLADDLPLTEWLEKHIWPAENRWLSPDFVYDATELACLEMLKGGVTTYNDMYFFGDSAAAAAKKIGMRAVLGVGILDFPTASAKTTDEYFENAERFLKNWKGDELITPCIAPHAVYTCSPETLMRSKIMAEKFDLPLHIHLSETEWEVGEIMVRYRRRPVEHLEAIGFLNEGVLAAHCIWLEDNEIELLAKRKVNVSHCMESNLKLASGFAPVVTMLMAGIKVTFGTDGAASNNDLNIMSEMATTAKVHKTLANNPTVLDSKTALTMATRWGAEALGLGGSIGSIEKDKMADLITIDLRKPHLQPIYDIYSQIVYSAMASDVETVMVNGKLIINAGRLVTGDEDEILQKAAEWGGKIATYNSVR